MTTLQRSFCNTLVALLVLMLGLSANQALANDVLNNVKITKIRSWGGTSDRYGKRVYMSQIFAGCNFMYIDHDQTGSDALYRFALTASFAGKLVGVEKGVVTPFYDASGNLAETGCSINSIYVTF